MEIDMPIADLTVSWAGAVGVISYVMFLRTRRTRSALEAKVLFLLACLTVLFTVRGIFWITDSVAFGVLAFVAASLLPLASTLFAEGLMRRHVARWFKVFIIVGTPVSLVLNVHAVTSAEHMWLGVFITFLLLTLGYLGIWLAGRDRNSLSPAENKLIDAMLVTAFVALLLAATDFRTTLLEGFPVRLGSIGGLVLVFVLSSRTELGGSHGNVARELVLYLLFSGVLAVPFVGLFGEPRLDVAVAVWAMAYSLLLMMIVIERLRRRKREERISDFNKWLIGPELQNMEQLLEHLRTVAASRECILLETDDLHDYSSESLCELLMERGGSVDKSTARAMKEMDDAPSRELGEQLDDMLRRHDMTHVCLVRREPCCLLLFNLPEIANDASQPLETRLVYTVGRIMEAQ